MKKAVFVIAPFQGHMNQAFQYAKSLEKFEIDCVFASPENMRSIIQQNGFSFHPFNGLEFGTGQENMTSNGERRSFIDNMYLRLTGELFKKRFDEYMQLLSKVATDYLLLDTFLSTDLVVCQPLLRKRNVSICFLQMMYSPILSLKIPQITSVLLPSDRLLIILNFFKCKIVIGAKRIFKFFVFFGYDDYSLLKRQLKKTETNVLSIRKDRLFHVSFYGIPEILLAPIEFDFKFNQSLTNQYYSSYSSIANSSFLGESKAQEIVDGMKIVKSCGRKVIYCSLGTLHSVHTSNKSILFFKKVITAFVDREQFYLIISVGMELFDKIKVSSDNVQIFATVPQCEILKLADVFITHGGLNSVIEGIISKVPMAVYPLTNKWDQNGNAARVVYHGVGLRGSFRYDTEAEIQNRVNALLFNSVYRINLEKLCRKISMGSENAGSELPIFYSTTLE